jgi:hypothetical protein
MAMVMSASAAAADESPAARARLDGIIAGLHAIERDLPRITAAAEQAATAYLDGAPLATVGGGLHLLLAQQPGGFNDDYGLPPTADAITLAAGDDPDVRRRPPPGRVVITIGAHPLGDAIWLNHHASGDRNYAAATLTAAVAWALRVEMFAACVRQGDSRGAACVPVVRRDAELDTRLSRNLRYGDQRFHHDVWLEPIPPGRLGRALLIELRAVLRDVGTTSWPAVVAAMDEIADVRRHEGRALVRFGPAYAAGHLCPDGPLQYLDSISEPHERDVVIAFTFDESPRWLEWRERDRLTLAGRTVWITPSRHIYPGDLNRRDIHLDPQIPLGNACVRIAGYDTPLGDVTGVIAAAIMAILEASP